ncbi:hypothetical protein SPRG_11719 [Saprolegnia parasitica CBS 223.65]|uniref:Uncharacterized protein n=1 Tax=Saprolegnia parasitica (strain CBS 223.65) TaxID=695850 RepID=A0A067C6U6_SAPPC|nr:hypothetical protein SPRG_11719 [Saprolegnia parasitica CBS 223.65]KDO22537.1 hypothetical protein SPRG_11719 [Saprolegnia parasitica CBS 223.65]|eukprot:XP_012206783.1 hypothetical protein SPRG_11719 [Saprolegnia parasitica CBS 223.65]
MLPNALLKAGDATMLDYLFSNMQVFVLCTFLFYSDAMRELELTRIACGEQGAIPGELLRMDHTFRVAKFGKDANGEKKCSCIATTMNEHQEV